jgi:hypothetical protein
MRTPKMRHCFNCGAEMGVYADYDPMDTCGAIECNREAAAAESQRREEAHEQLDRDMGYGGYW